MKTASGPPSGRRAGALRRCAGPRHIALRVARRYAAHAGNVTLGIIWPPTLAPRRGDMKRQSIESLEARRMLSAGDFDLSFGNQGTLVEHLGDVVHDPSIAVQRDGKYLVAATVSRSGS